MLNAVSAETDVVLANGDDESGLIHYRDPSSASHTHESTVTKTLKQRLENAFFGEDPQDILERQPYGDLATLEYGVIVLVDMFHDDTIKVLRDGGDPNNQEDYDIVNAGLTEMLGSFCMYKTIESEGGCIGVLGTQPIYTGNDVHQKVLDLVSLTESLEDTEAYKYVQVIVGSTTFPETNGEVVSCAYTFGSVQALLPYNTIMSNKAMYGFAKLNSLITKEDVALLSCNGYTCIVPSIRRGFVPFISVSYSKQTTVMTSKPHNIRISQHITFCH
jgi:hypothetical protein